MFTRSKWRILAICAVLAYMPACSVKRMAVNRLGNALASGSSTYERDDDPDLVGEALPFGLKVIESLLAESPKHKGLLLAAASGFTSYSYAFVDQLAEESADQNRERSNALRARARRLYLRARGYGLRGLEAQYPGFSEALDRDAPAALARVRPKDVPLLYWTAAAQGLAISLSKDQPEMIAQLPLVEALIQRIMELDEVWGKGLAQEFLINLEAARPGTNPAARQKGMQGYFERARKLSGGKRASLFVTYAENACVPAQNRSEFQALLAHALRIDPDQQPEDRLANLIAQRRARRLLARINDLFLEAAPPTP